MKQYDHDIYSLKGFHAHGYDIRLVPDNPNGSICILIVFKDGKKVAEDNNFEAYKYSEHIPVAIKQGLKLVGINLPLEEFKKELGELLTKYKAELVIAETPKLLQLSDLLEVARLGLAMIGDEIAEQMDISDKELQQWVECLDNISGYDMPSGTFCTLCETVHPLD